MLLIRKLLNSKRGQAMVEMALALPLIIMLIMGTIEFGRLFHSYLLVSNASREGARIAVTGVDNSVITSRINDVTASLDSSKVIIISPNDADLRVSAVPVTVTINYNHSIVTPVFESILPNPITLTSSTSMRME